MPATVLPCTDQKFTSRLFAPVAPSLERLRLEGRCPLGLKSPRSSRSRAYDCAGKLITGHYRSRGAGCGDLCGYNGGLGRRTGAEEDVGRTDTHTRMASRNSRLSLEPVHAPFHPSTSRLDTRNSIVSAPLKLTRARDIPDASVRRTPPSCIRGSKPLTARRLPPPPRHRSRRFPHRISTTPRQRPIRGNRARQNLEPRVLSLRSRVANSSKNVKKSFQNRRPRRLFLLAAGRTRFDARSVARGASGDLPY
jgi:hypothetical protein